MNGMMKESEIKMLLCLDRMSQSFTHGQDRNPHSIGENAFVH